MAARFGFSGSYAAVMLLREVVELLHQWYPPRFAEEWDRVGLVCGDLDAEVTSILLAVDPTRAVAQEAVDKQTQLLIVHHPLYLRGTSSVAAQTPKGEVVHRLISAGVGLLTAHTNADTPASGVSAAMAQRLGLVEAVPLDPAEQPYDQLVVFVPIDAAEAVRGAMASAGAGHLGNYDSCTFSLTGTGRFRPLEGAQPAIGQVGAVEAVEEVRIEALVARESTPAVIEAIRQAHPYEEVAHFVSPQNLSAPSDRGAGRIGQLPQPMSLREFAELVRQQLPATAHGVRVAGDPEKRVSTVALCGGSGDFLLDQARAVGADVYLTSDLRHHPALEHREYHSTTALVDVAHWAAEWCWLPLLQSRLQEHLGEKLKVEVSTLNTDPWTFRV